MKFNEVSVVLRAKAKWYEVYPKIMYYTYILKSAKQEGAIYIGTTQDLKSRLVQHNDLNKTHYSSRHAPWMVESYFAFSDKIAAQDFEKYLKSNSGKAFLRKRLISNDFKMVLKKFNNGRAK